MSETITSQLLPMEAPVARCLAGGTVSGVRQVQDILVVVVDAVAFAAAIGTAVVVAVSIVVLVAATVTISPKWRTQWLYKSATMSPPDLSRA